MAMPLPASCGKREGDRRTFSRQFDQGNNTDWVLCNGKWDVCVGKQDVCGENRMHNYGEYHLV